MKSKPAVETAKSILPGRFLLFLTVSLSGGAVMILELLGTRIVAPYYGVSLYVWSALIAVTMIALAIGYYLGGYLCDRTEKVRLAHVILFAALTSAILPFISGTILAFTNPLGIRAGAFVAAFLLFSLPLTALAMVGPYVIKLATRDLQGIGRAVGSVYAVSTIGSVLATLLLAFYLLPVLGTRSILLSLSLLLLLLAVVWVFKDKSGFTGLGATIPVLLIAGLVGLLTSNGYTRATHYVNGFKVVYEQESNYGWVRVVDDQRNGFRLLLSDSSVLSAVEMAHGHSLLGYQTLVNLLPPLFRPDAKQALLIGLGGGQVARDLHSQGLAVDTIEIDPVVAQVAKDYFNFKPSGEFVVGDARYEIKSLQNGYDFIVHDCFTGGSEPTHMLTQEMLRELSGLLNSNGVLALNYVGYTQGEGSEAVASVYKTLSSLFENVRVFVTKKEEFTDFIFVASKQSLDNASFQVDDKRGKWLLEHEYNMTANNGVLITDDFNPLESMQVRKAENYRKIFMGRIAPELLLL